MVQRFRSLSLTPEGLNKAQTTRGLNTEVLTYEKMAERLGLSAKTVSRFFHGRAVDISSGISILSSLGFSEDEIASMTHPGVGESRRISININNAVEEISDTPVDDVQGIAAAQLAILSSYYSEGLTQAKTSFRWAAIVSGIGFAFFVTAVIFVLNRQPRDRTLIPLISGAVIEVVAGINFYLYGQATKQLASFQHRLDQTQRFLLANSICESLEGESKQSARVELVKTVSSIINQSD